MFLDFKEKQLGPDFAKEKMADFKRLIEGDQSFTVVSMPGVGVSYFLKYLVCQNLAYFIHIDLYNLPTLSQHEFYRMFHRDLGGKPTSSTDEQVFLEIKAKIKKLAEENQKVVVIFSRFDQLKKDLDENFLSNLQALTAVAPGQIVLIFTAVKALYEMAPEAVRGGNLTFYSKILYFTPYSPKDAKALFLLDHTLRAHPDLDEIIKLSGGHNQLLHIFINSHKKTNLLLDKFVRLQLRDLYNYLDYQQKKDVQKIALGKKVDPDLIGVDEYLLGVNYIIQDKGGTRVFSPILQEYIRTNLPTKLPVKEAKLFKLLRNNAGKVVSKDEIFQNVWGDSADATDWALDALIYRLRNSQFMKSHGYILESHKKVGYTLIQV